VVLDVTAKTESGSQVFSHKKEWKEVGIDLDGKQRVKAWEIKNTIDLALQPRRIHTERLTIPLPEGTGGVEIEAVLTYHHRPGEEFVVHKLSRKVTLPK
jgi:hypothetical protein